VPADLGEPDAPLAVLDQVISVFGTLDVLVNNAGLGHVGSSDQLTPREVDQVLGLNARAALLLAGHAAGHMARSGGGSIVTISSALSIAAIQ
jgi:NAD(P)-dependent dehydrogenase (short-subunit alcohol dehydrogenase family)